MTRPSRKSLKLKQRPSPVRRGNRQLRFEDLESRKLLAGVPTASIVGTTDGYQGVRAQTRVVNFKATDPNPVDQAGTFAYTINWGDGVVQVANGPSALQVSHVYNYNGAYPITVQVRDQDGITSAYSPATTLNIGIVEQQGPSVALGGTYGYDLFTLDQQATARTFAVGVNYVAYGNYTIGSGGQVLMFGNANYDQAYLNGSAGNDAFVVTPTGAVFNGVPVVGDGVETWNIAGNAGTDTLTGADVANNWQLGSQNAGVLNTNYNFATVENLGGGSATDYFHFISLQQLTGTINGGAGLNTLDDSQLSGALTIDLAAGAATGTGGIANINAILGNSVTVTVVGPNANNVWNLNGTRAGNINGTITFSGVTKIVGGNQADQFKFTDSALGLSVVDGGGGFDTLDHSAMVAAARVIMKNPAALSTSLIGQFLNIESVVGSTTALGTLYGPDVDANWSIDGQNQGSVSSAALGSVAFSKFNFTAGGQGTDIFAFKPGGSVTGVLDGGAGVNVLDYSYYNQGVAVNLGTKSATGTPSIANFRMVLGSAFNDTFVGDTVNDVFFGNAGDDNITGGSTRDFLVGGTGADTIHGGDSYDLIYGGSTIYYNEATHALDLATINQILAVWMTSLDYYPRVAQINATLVNDSTLINDNAIDQLWGDQLRDWFLRDPNDVVNDYDPTLETITNVHVGPASFAPVKTAAVKNVQQSTTTTTSTTGHTSSPISTPSVTSTQPLVIKKVTGSKRTS